jgi:hypothetical protein
MVNHEGADAREELGVIRDPIEWDVSADGTAGS